MTDLATLTEGEFWPLIEQARDRVITNDVDALEALIVAGLPPDEMQAAAWALVQRVRGLRADLMRVQRDVVAARATEATTPERTGTTQRDDAWTVFEWNRAFDEAMRWRDWQTCERLFAERETESWWPEEKTRLSAMPDPPGAGWQE